MPFRLARRCTSHTATLLLAAGLSCRRTTPGFTMADTGAMSDQQAAPGVAAADDGPPKEKTAFAQRNPVSGCQIPHKESRACNDIMALS